VFRKELSPSAPGGLSSLRSGFFVYVNSKRNTKGYVLIIRKGICYEYYLIKIFIFENNASYNNDLYIFGITVVYVEIGKRGYVDLHCSYYLDDGDWSWECLRLGRE